MKFSKAIIPGIVVIEPTVLSDKRGYFLESFNKNEFEKAIGKVSFVQDNESRSSKGVLRGLHYQKPPFAQAKLVRCIEGEILDIAVDIRKDSPTYGLYHSDVLSSENKKQLFIPKGFAHGFVVLSEYAVFAYKVDNTYAPDYEAGILWNDKELGVEWGVNEKEIFISDKDDQLPLFSEFKSPFKLLL
jgi:dTDP-4-dehydrorhamnose 3,5-epimerase